MPRVPLITDRNGLDDRQAETFDWVMESRGAMVRPFQVLLHSPEIARRIAELGHFVRFESNLEDADRELVTLAVGRAHGCAFVWDSHVEAARSAGVRDEAIAALASAEGDLAPREHVLVSFARELISGSAVSDETFAAAHDLLGTAGVVELAAIIGYYTMLGYTMAATEAC